MSINKRLTDKTTDKHNYFYGIIIIICPVTRFGPRRPLSGYKNVLSGYCCTKNIIVSDGCLIN